MSNEPVTILSTQSSKSSLAKLKDKYQKVLDNVVPHRMPRWIVTIIILGLYALRVFFLQGWYIVTYALAIYILNLFIAFISPKFDLHEEDDDDDSGGFRPDRRVVYGVTYTVLIIFVVDGLTLPTKSGDEFKPFIRRLPEFKFWLSMTRAILIATTCTFFSFFNIPVFWPILVLYFIILFSITMKRQIKHMIRYKYIPFSHGKRRYKGKDESLTAK